MLALSVHPLQRPSPSQSARQKPDALKDASSRPLSRRKPRGNLPLPRGKTNRQERGESHDEHGRHEILGLPNMDEFVVIGCIADMGLKNNPVPQCGRVPPERPVFRSAATDNPISPLSGERPVALHLDLMSRPDHTKDQNVGVGDQ